MIKQMIVRLTQLVLFVSFFIIIVPGFASAGNEDLELVVGRSQTFNRDYSIGDVAITDQSVVDYIVQPSRKEIYLNPLKEGKATLTIWDEQGAVKDIVTLTVVSVKIDTVLRDVKNELRNVSGVRMKLIGDRTILLTGEVGSNAELSLINLLQQKYPQVQSRVTISSRVLEVTAKQIADAINTPGITVRPVRGTLVMEGLTYSKDLYKKIDTIARLYKEDIVNLVEVREEGRRPGYTNTVKLDVYFMEVKNSALRTFGINWAPGSTIQNAANQNSGSGNTFGLIDFNSIVGFVFNLLPKLKWIHETNRGRVLEKTSFVVKSGEPVNFYSGTQIPYFSQSNVTFKEVGIRVNAEPITSEKNIDLKINVNVSAPSATVSQGIDTNTLSTTVYVKSGESVVLGGLLRNNDVKTFNKVPPGLDTTNALFTLFLSRDFQTNKSQFYIFIEPNVIEQVSTAELELKRWLELNDSINAARR
ncbi:MAG: pilus assembly protein N-terminal domain-containing protein [Pseudomonadota bacterium]